ncbi:MAG: glycosyltransferase, partial [Ginsengibacter sp.]
MPANIIWLPSWYPNILGPFDGDFIQRHARAVSASAKLTVVFFKKDTESIITNDLKKTVSVQNNLQEIICYYRPVRTRLKLLNRLISFYTYRKVYKKILTELINENGRPDLVHVHVALAAAAPALWLKKKYQAPLLISEHWTGYLPSALYGISDLHIFQRKLMEQLFASAMVLTAVSKVLGDSIKEHFIAPDYVVVPNVVNTDIFYPLPGPAKSVCRFIHISTLSFQKNIEAIINAFEIIKHKGCSFELIIFGPPSETLYTLIVNADLAGNICLKNEVPQPELAKYVQEADALILFSRYET